MSGTVADASGGAPIRASVIVPMLNRETHIAPLLESLFSHWRADLELILVDDASRDASLAVALKVLERHPEVDAVVLRVGRTQGMRMIGLLQSIARGQIFIQADSDDLSFPDRLADLLQCFDENDDCRLVTSNTVLITPESLFCGLLDTTRGDAVLRDPNEVGLADWGLRGLGATMAYHRHVFDMFPPIDPDLCPYGLDLVVPMRAVLIGSHHYLAKPLVGWRQHAGNTHRLAGAQATGAAARERYHAFELMALAQNIRDVESLRSSRSAGTIDTLIKSLRDRFSTRFDEWCRLRARALEASDADAKGPRETTFVPTVAPILSMRVGETLRFSKDDPRAKLVACGAGFHGPEDWGMWTQRIALFNLRVDTGGAKHLRLSFELTVPASLLNERVAISVDGHGWVEAVARGGPRLHIDVVCPSARAAPILGVVILARDAMVPAEASGSADARLLGVGLVSLSMRAADGEA